LKLKLIFKKILTLLFLRAYKISKLLIETIFKTFFLSKKIIIKKLARNEYI
jgi:hypothetical protein